MDDLKRSVENAWVSCWLHHHINPEIKRLPPHLWEKLRLRLQSIYRDATGEELAVLVIEEPKP